VREEKEKQSLANKGQAYLAESNTGLTNIQRAEKKAKREGEGNEGTNGMGRPSATRDKTRMGRPIGG